MSKIYSYGIDTSKWQASKVDYAKAKEKGIEFVILRIGYNKTKDKCFEQDYSNAIACGLKVGVYFYTLAKNETDATADATRVLGWLNNRHLDFPIAFDVENNVQKKLTKNENSNIYNAFRNKIESTLVYDCMLYTGENFFNTYFNKTMIKDDIWIAKYSSTEPYVNRKISMWQFTSDYIDEEYYKGKLDRNYMLVEKMRQSETPIENIYLNPYAVPTRILKLKIPRMRGNDVKWLQYQLGMSYDEVDGIFGPHTRQCLIDFQKKNGLLVDGICGSASIYALTNF